MGSHINDNRVKGLYPMHPATVWLVVNTMALLGPGDWRRDSVCPFGVGSGVIRLENTRVENWIRLEISGLDGVDSPRVLEFVINLWQPLKR